MGHTCVTQMPRKSYTCNFEKRPPSHWMSMSLPYMAQFSFSNGGDTKRRTR